MKNLCYGACESFNCQHKWSCGFTLLVLQLLLNLLHCNYLMACQWKILLVLSLALPCLAKEFIYMDCQGLKIWRRLLTPWRWSYQEQILVSSCQMLMFASIGESKSDMLSMQVRIHCPIVLYHKSIFWYLRILWSLCRNLSLGIGMCPQSQWEKVKGSWVKSMSPFDHKVLDIRTASSSLERFEVSIEEGDSFN